MKNEIREDEWLAELEKLSKRNDSGRTSEEIATAFNVSLGRARRMLQRAMQMGWLTTGFRSILRIDGRPTMATVYTIRRPAAAKSRRKGR